MARKAVELVPNASHRNTLGVAYYRLGRWREAVPEFEASLKDNDEEAFDLYFLAMCYHQLNEPARAKEYFDRAVRWHEEKAAGLPENHRAELTAFRAEAEALLKADR